MEYWQEVVTVDLGSLYWKHTDLPHVAWAAVVRKAGCLWRVEEFPVLHRLRGLEDKMFSPLQRTPCSCISACLTAQATELHTDGLELLLGTTGTSKIPACSPFCWRLSALSGWVILSQFFLLPALSPRALGKPQYSGSWLLESRDQFTPPNLPWELRRG